MSVPVNFQHVYDEAWDLLDRIAHMGAQPEERIKVLRELSADIDSMLSEQYRQLGEASTNATR